MSNRILSNLGFLLQTAGLLTLLPIGVGFAVNETQQVIPLFITCITFLACGFLLNALCERKDLDIKSSSLLLLLSFLILPLIGAIPYMYLDPFNSATPFDRFTNSYFESVSGFTTAGFSFIENTDTLARSMLVFRSITELMGGVGVVFLILAFFQSKGALPKVSGVLGIDNLNRNLRKMYFLVFAIYGISIAIFTGLFYVAGFRDVLISGTFVIDTITGGFAPTVLQFQQYLSFIPEVLIIFLMLIGSVNFAFNYYLLTWIPKIEKDVPILRRLGLFILGKIKKAFSFEVCLYLAIIAVASIAFVFAANIGFMDSVFHVVSMASSTGHSYINFSTLNANAISILIIVMVIGGCAFSMAGGIKVSRFVTVGEAIVQKVKMVFYKSARESKKQTNGSSEPLHDLATILLFIVFLLVFAWLFSTIGVSFMDALFEVGSAITTTGASLGITTVTLPLAYKWLMIAAMTIGRVEILTIFIALIPTGIKLFKRKRIT
jgi:trk system potassium uptake protein TrkH